MVMHNYFEILCVTLYMSHHKQQKLSERKVLQFSRIFDKNRESFPDECSVEHWLS